MSRRAIKSIAELDNILVEHWRTSEGDDPDPAGIFHAKAILGQEYPSEPSTVYAILDDFDEIVAIVTVVKALLPRTTGRTLRVNSIILSPQFGIDMPDHARLEQAFAHTIYEMALDARETPLCEHVKVFFGGQADRQLVEPIRDELRRLPHFNTVDFQGQWLNVTLS